MELSQLKYFLKIAEHRSFTNAAAECSVSQPALSQQIKKLEAELGQPLFDRRRHNLQLTEAGQLLKTRGEQILQMVDDVTRQINDDGRSGQVTLAAIPTIGPYLLPQVLGAMSEQFPGARFSVGEAVTGVLQKQCTEGDVNIGLVALPFEAPNLSVEPLFREELLLALPKTHRLCAKSSVSLADLSGERFVFLNKVHCLVNNIETFCHQQQFHPVVTNRIQQLITLQNLVSQGQGLSFIPRMAATANGLDNVVYRSLAGPQPSRTIALCTNAKRYQSQLVVNILKAIREQISQEDFKGDSDSSSNPGEAAGQTKKKSDVL